MKYDSEKIESILISALEISSESERLAYIENGCGHDEVLQREVKKLVENHFLAGDFLKSSASQLPAVDLEPPRDRIGPFRIIEQIGEGGFGVVYKAEQLQPIRRTVALKVIRPGMDTSQLVARFENERQAIALMEHPNIARVLDVGETESGQPYFAMELVNGVPITEYCDKKRFTTRQRLQLFESVCQAVQHAHQKGIIHRDIKPNNVLIAELDGLPVAKIIDFGVAKAIKVNLLDASLKTTFGTILGTPQYMSPEQAASKEMDVDTRTDVYSLGVLLYELLTGSPPFDKKWLADGVIEMLRVIREEDPPTPNARLSNSDTLKDIAANRSIEPRQLSLLLRRDIEWIVMKCLEKDRSRRYATANGLARDIERFLNQEPVEAGPLGTGYRLRKFLRRNRGKVIASALLLFSLLIGIVGTFLGLVKAKREQNTARIEQGNAVLQRDRAERNYQRAMEAVDRLLTRVGETDLAPVPFMDKTRLRLLEDALQFYRGFLTDEGDASAVRRDVGRAHGRIARIQVMLGRLSDAQLSCDNAIQIQTDLMSEFGDDGTYRLELDKTKRQLATILHLSGHSAQAETLLREVLNAEADNNIPARYEWTEFQLLLGSVCHDSSQPVQAEAALGLALGSATELERDEPDSQELRQLKARILNRIGVLYRETQRLGESQRTYQEAIEILRKLVVESPDVPIYQLSLSSILSNLGTVCNAQMLLPQAQEAFQESVDAVARLVREHPDVVTYKELYAKVHNNFGLYYSKCNDPIRAAAENELAMKAHEELMNRFPTWLAFKYNFAGGCSNQGKYFLDQENWTEALHWNSKAIDAIAPVLAMEPRNSDARRALHGALIGRARVYRELNQPDNASQDYRRSLELSEGEKHSHYVNYRPRALAYLGEHTQATTEAEAILAAGNVTGSTYRDLASVFGQCMDKVQKDTDLTEVDRLELTEKYATRSVDLLKNADSKGYFIKTEQVEFLLRDERLASMQDRSEFKDFLSMLENRLLQETTSEDQRDRH